MLGRNDIFTVAVTDEMKFAAVDYAEKTLHYTFNRMGLASHYKRIQNIVKGIVMERAFRALLDHHEVAYELLGNTHWTKKDRYDVGINGHRYDIKGFMVAGKAAEIKEDPGWLLDCCALVPSDQIESRNLTENDRYVFPFMTGDFMAEIGDVYGLFSSLEFLYLLHSFWGYEWAKNEDWEDSKGKITVESNMSQPIILRIGGQGEDQDLLVDEFEIGPGEKKILDGDYYTMLFAQTLDRPTGELNVFQEETGVEEVIGLYDWGNAWPYGATVYLAGHIKKGEFKQSSTSIPRFYKDCKQYSETRVENHMMMVGDLSSLRDLLPDDSSLEI